MENPRSEEEKIIKNIRNLFRLKRKIKELKMEYLEILFEHEKEEEKYVIIRRNM